jgi:hypothetical protein
MWIHNTVFSSQLFIPRPLLILHINICIRTIFISWFNSIKCRINRSLLKLTRDLILLWTPSVFKGSKLELSSRYKNLTEPCNPIKGTCIRNVILDVLFTPLNRNSRLWEWHPCFISGGTEFKSQYLNWHFLWFSSVPSGECQNRVPN